jgi:hypothetical protein
MSQVLWKSYEEEVEERVAAAAAAAAAKAEAEAEAEARSRKAELDTQRADLRALLSERFGSVSEEIEQRIVACEDSERLRRALIQVLRAASSADLDL